MKRFGLSLFCLVLSTTVLPLASASASQAPVSPALCPGNGGAQILFASTSCLATRCTDDSECWENCTQATSAACVSGTCQYTLPGDGGGTGSGGECPVQNRCSDDTDCSYPSFGLQGTCVSGVCQC
jgi:hypothetical protein